MRRPKELSRQCVRPGTMRKAATRVGAFLIGTAVAAPAWACTLCHSRTAEEVRAAVFGPDFWSNLGALSLPVPILLGAVLLVRNVSP